MPPVWTPSVLPTSTEHRVSLGEQLQAHAEVEKVKKYSHLNRLYQFQAVAVESGGTIGPLSKIFLRHLGRRLRMSTGEPKLYDYLIQRISMVIQVGNAVSVLGSLPISSIPFGDVDILD